MAGESNPYAAGSKVYNGGSSAATQGAVDPMGYIDRSLNSTPNPGAYTPGVAAGALSSLRTQNAVSPDSETPRSAGTTTAPTAPVAAPAPTQSSTTGAISWKMPVDYDLQLQGIQANSDYNDLLTQITAQKNAATQTQVMGLRDAGIGEQKQTRQDTNNASYRGMARSSGYVNQVDQTQQFFNNLKSDIESRFMAALNGADSMALQGKTRVDATMEAIYREAAQRLADKIANDPNAGALDPITGEPINTPPGTKPTVPKGSDTPTKGASTSTPIKPPTKPKPKSNTKGFTAADVAAAKKRGYSLWELAAAKRRKAGQTSSRTSTPIKPPTGG
jgi:hypothetical protein